MEEKVKRLEKAILLTKGSPQPSLRAKATFFGKLGALGSVGGSTRYTQYSRNRLGILGTKGTGGLFFY